MKDGKQRRRKKEEQDRNKPQPSPKAVFAKVADVSDRHYDTGVDKDSIVSDMSKYLVSKPWDDRFNYTTNTYYVNLSETIAGTAHKAYDYRGPAKRQLPPPEVTLYHGTALWALPYILKYGFIASKDGLLGPGVYLGGLNKALGYVRSSRMQGEIGSALIRVRANLGVVAQKKRDKDADTLTTANTIAGVAGVTSTWNGTLRHDEWCVRDPNSISIEHVMIYRWLLKEVNAKTLPIHPGDFVTFEDPLSHSRKEGWAVGVERFTLSTRHSPVVHVDLIGSGKRVQVPMSKLTVKELF